MTTFLPTKVMWTLLEATLYLIFAISSPSSVFIILSFKNPALETNCASISLISLSMFLSPSLVLVRHSSAKLFPVIKLMLMLSFHTVVTC